VIAILDYQAGNLASVKKALDYLGYTCVVTGDPSQVRHAKKVVVPGVGNFAATMKLAELGLESSLRGCIEDRKPVLGVCLGMQWMFDSSEEAPETHGLGLFPGCSRHFPIGFKSPHVGWNELEVRSKGRLFRGISSGAFFYFTHAYRVPVIEDTVAVAEYGGDFSAAVERDNLFGVQFHPEKSGDQGLTLLKNFCDL
jgi:imidazole glycerol-phosphate synthase subunit HisH